MSDVIDWGEVGGRMFYAPVGSLDFKEVGTTIKRVNCLSAGEPQSHYNSNTLSFEVEVKMSDKERRKLFALFFTKVRLPRKTKKAIKKQCPGITPREIQQILQVGKVRRIKHKRKSLRIQKK